MNTQTTTTTTTPVQAICSTIRVNSKLNPGAYKYEIEAAVKLHGIDPKNRPEYISEIHRQLEVAGKRQALNTPPANLRVSLRASRRLRQSAKLRKGFSYREASMGNFFYVNEGAKSLSFDSQAVKVWPGGDTHNEFGNGTTYSKSSHQSATWVDFILNLPYKHSFAFVGGLLTVWEGKLNRNQATPVTWFEQSRGTRLKAAQGFFYKEHHMKAKTAADAVRRISKIRKETASAEIKARKLRLAKTMELTKIWVSEADSAAGGNCKAGTNNFAGRLGLNLSEIGAVRADWLLKNAGEQINFVTRAISAARRRTATI